MRNENQAIYDSSWNQQKSFAMGSLFRLRVSLGIILLGILSTVTCGQREPAFVRQVAHAGQLPTLAGLAARSMPAVVNISTTQKGEWRQYSPFPTPGPFGRDNPFEDFLRRFYGDRPPMGKRRSLGSGFIMSTDGYIVTNNHVVQGASKIIVHLTDSDRRTYPARLIGTDEETDLALIKIDAPHALPTLSLGSSEALNVGEWVIAIGNPFGLEQTVTAGIVSAKERVLGAGPYDDFIQIDASINPGNSGGPLLNMEGKVVGVNTVIFSQNGVNSSIGFAIPIDLAKPIVAQLRETGTVARAWLGVSIQAITPELASALGLPERRGALVSHVVPESPADKGGLQKGDVILKIGEAAIPSVRELPTVVAQQSPGEQTRITVLRDGKERMLRVVLEKMGNSQAEITPSEIGMPQWGMMVTTLTSAVEQRLQMEKQRPGVVVVEVDPASPAADAGLRPGDIIEEVNRVLVSSVQSFVEEVAKVKEKDRLLLLVRRSGYATFLVLRKDTSALG